MASKKKVGGKEVTRVFETYICIYITLLKIKKNSYDALRKRAATSRVDTESIYQNL